MRRFVFPLLILAGCSTPAAEPAAVPTAEPTATAPIPAEAPAEPPPESQPAPRATGPAQFGAPMAADGTEIPLATLIARADDHVGSRVRTSGEVARVCQKAGCWMELQAEDGALRVPMAGHAFFIPKDAAGRQAVVEGELKKSELSQGHKEHLKGEGASLVGALALHATSVHLK